MALYGVGTMLYNAVYGRTSTESVAAINIMEVIANCSKIFMLGAAGAASVIVGREIGDGKTEEAFFNFVVDTIGVWGISLPLLYLTGIVLHLDIEIVYAMSLIEIVIKSFVVRYRIKKCHWARNLVGKGRKIILSSQIKKAAIVSAMEIELEYVDEFLKERQGWKKTEENVYEYEQGKLQVITRIMGVGKVNAAYQTADVIHAYHPDLIINVGYAGGLIKEAPKGDVAIGREYVQVDFIPFLDENRPEVAESPGEFIRQLEQEARELEIPTFTGKIATGDFFLHDSKQRKEIIEEFSPIAFDMESAAVGQVTTAKNTPFIALRTFSDLADENAVEAIEANREENTRRIPIEQRPIVLALTTLEKVVA